MKERSRSQKTGRSQPLNLHRGRMYPNSPSSSTGVPPTSAFSHSFAWPKEQNSWTSPESGLTNTGLSQPNTRHGARSSPATPRGTGISRRRPRKPRAAPDGGDSGDDSSAGVSPLAVLAETQPTRGRIGQATPALPPAAAPSAFAFRSKYRRDSALAASKAASPSASHSAASRRMRRLRILTNFRSRAGSPNLEQREHTSLDPFLKDSSLHPSHPA
eukprot:3938215-Rhodomonas_salina.1